MYFDKIYIDFLGEKMNYIYEDQEELRLDIFLTTKMEKKTRSYIKTLISSDKIRVNGKNVKAGYLLKNGDVIEVEEVEEKVISASPEKIDLNILYEDDDIIIVNKKKGMVVHPANGNYSGTLVNALMYSHLNNLSSINGVIRPGIVHRIDKDTSGILVVAKNDNAHKFLSEQFKVHSIKREYVALVKGIIKEDELTINAPIGRSTKDRKKMAITDKNSKEAITHIKVLERFYNSNITFIKATLETGRTHQIRVHMASIAHQLLADGTYGKEENKFGIKGHMLHAMTLGIIHPTSKEYMEFSVKPPEEFENVLEKLRKIEKNKRG